MILDDYNYWQGQRAAVVEYFAEQGIHMMLTFLSTSATGVKAVPHGLTKAERAEMQRTQLVASIQKPAAVA